MGEPCGSGQSAGGDGASLVDTHRWANALQGEHDCKLVYTLCEGLNCWVVLNNDVPAHKKSVGGASK